MEWFGSFEPENNIEEIPALGSDHSVVTFIVTKEEKIIFTRERTRHLALLSRTLHQQSEIVWGGVLSKEGSWIRQSFDFGDAPNASIRNYVIVKIQKALFL